VVAPRAQHGAESACAMRAPGRYFAAAIPPRKLPMPKYARLTRRDTRSLASAHLAIHRRDGLGGRGRGLVRHEAEAARAAGELVRHHLGLPPGKYSVVRGGQPRPPANLALSPPQLQGPRQLRWSARKHRRTPLSQVQGSCRSEACARRHGIPIIPSAPDLAGTELRELGLQALVVDAPGETADVQLVLVDGALGSAADASAAAPAATAAAPAAESTTPPSAPTAHLFEVTHPCCPVTGP
jgi:hypothetical protein